MSSTIPTILATSGQQVNVSVIIDENATLTMEFLPIVQDSKVSQQTGEDAEMSQLTLALAGGYVEPEDMGNTQTGNMQISSYNNYQSKEVQLLKRYKNNNHKQIAMKKYIIIIIISAGCSNVKSIYRENTLDVNNKSIQQILEKTKAKESNKSIVYFTSGFEGDTIELINGDRILFKLPVKTINQIGLANLETVSNDKEVKINILSPKSVRFVLNKEKLKTSKFVYISKEIFKNNKYIVEYSNLKKDFL